MADNSLSIFASVSKEFRCDESGNGFISLRGLARLCGVRRQTWGQGGSIFTAKIDETVIAQGFVFDQVAVKGIPDTIAAVVILHYAQVGKETAQKSLMAFAAYGLRRANEAPPPVPRWGNASLSLFKMLMVNHYGRFKLAGCEDMPLFKTQTVFMIQASNG
jgi:hypothetical protein